MRLDNPTATNPLNEGADGGMGFGIIMLLVIAGAAALAVTALGAFDCHRDQTQRPTEQSLEIEVEPKPDVEPMKQAYPISTLPNQQGMPQCHHQACPWCTDRDWGSI